MTEEQVNALCRIAGEIIVRAALKRWEEQSPETFVQKSLHWGVRHALAQAVERIVEVADEARLAVPAGDQRTLVFFEQVRIEAIKVMDQELERIAGYLAMVERRKSEATQH